MSLSESQETEYFYSGDDEAEEVSEKDEEEFEREDMEWMCRKVDNLTERLIQVQEKYRETLLELKKARDDQKEMMKALSEAREHVKELFISSRGDVKST